MISEKLKELEDTRAKLLALEESVAADLRKELASLPAKYGFESTVEFVKAVRAASGKGRRKNRKTVGPRKKRGTRAVITDEIRESVKKMAGDGRTGAEIAKALGISIPSVQNIKKAGGLVKSRKK